MAEEYRQGFSQGPLPREEVQAMKGYSAPLEGRRNLLRLDFNENTIGPSPHVLNALKNFPSNEISIYPEYEGLKEAVIVNLKKRHLGLELQTSQVGLFNGADAAIHAIFQSYGVKGDKFVTTIPTFGYYTPCAQMQGMEILNIPYEGKSFDFPLEEILKTLKRYNPKIMIICNPNNPTGTITNSEDIIQIANSSPDSLIVIDELYEAFGEDSVMPVVNFNETPNLLVIQSLSKTAGLAGLRIGFSIGSEKVISNIKRVTGPYDINSFAVRAAYAALEDQDFIDKYIEEVLEAREWISAKLIRNSVPHNINGGNYMLIWPNKSPNLIAKYLKENGILIRDMSNQKYIEGSIRVTIGTKTQMQQFWEVFSRIESLSY